MNRTLILIFAAALITVSGCRRADNTVTTEHDDFSDQLERDIQALLQQIEDVAETAGTLDGRDTASECFETIGDCVFCYDLDGGPLAGTYSAGLETEPCSASIEIGSVSATYTVSESGFVGTWTAVTLAGDYTVNLEGGRSAELETTTARNGTTTYDSTVEIDISAETAGFEMSSWSLVLTYTGFGGHSWDVAMNWDTAIGWSGSITVSDGGTCSVAGTPAEPEVTCLRGTSSS